jgi:hypothetical protein
VKRQLEPGGFKLQRGFLNNVNARYYLSSQKDVLSELDTRTATSSRRRQKQGFYTCKTRKYALLGGAGCTGGIAFSQPQNGCIVLSDCSSQPPRINPVLEEFSLAGIIGITSPDRILKEGRQ